MYVCMYVYRLGISRIAYALSLSLVPRISKAAVHIKEVLHTLHWYFISLSFVLSVELHIAQQRDGVMGRAARGDEVRISRQLLGKVYAFKCA